MKLIFTTNERLVSGQGKWPDPMAFGATPAIAGFVEELYHKLWKRLQKHQRLVEVEVDHRPELSDKEVRRKNDEVCQALEIRLDHFEEIEKQLESKGSVAKALGRRKELLQEAGAAFVDLYRKEHGHDPRESLVKKVSKYDPEILAQIYVAYVVKTGSPEPSQDELSRFSQPSQPTWARYFADPEFWDNVVNRFDALWQADSIAKQKHEKAKLNKGKARRSDVDLDTISSRAGRASKKTPVGNAEEEDIDAMLDLRMRYEKMKKADLIRKLLKCDPELTKSELEEMDQESLVDLAIELEF